MSALPAHLARLMSARIASPAPVAGPIDRAPVFVSGSSPRDTHARPMRSRLQDAIAECDPIECHEDTGSFIMGD